jgi:hypothetical protein
MHAGLGKDDLMKGGVQLAVAETREPVAANATGGDLDRRAAPVAGKRRLAGEALEAAVDVAAVLQREAQLAARADESVCPGAQLAMRSQPAALRALGRELDVNTAASWRHGTTRS